MAMTEAEKNHLAKVMAERDSARREALEATIRGELRARGVTAAAARHLAVSFSHDTQIADDGTMTLNGKTTDEFAIAQAAAADAKLLGTGAFEEGHAPPPPAPKSGHARDGRPFGDLSVSELLAEDSARFAKLTPAQQRAERIARGEKV